MENETVTLTLQRPITSDKGETIRELTFRPPTLGDFIGAEKLGDTEFQFSAALLAGMSGRTYAEMTKLDMRDATAAIEMTKAFIPNRLAAAGRGSPT